ncbi:unnamed protein product, partial [Symbiodinium pilosum]
EVVVVRDSPRNEPEYLHGFLPPGLRLRERPIPPKESKNLWILVFCNAGYDNKQPCNHWMPGWYRQQLGDALFEEKVQESESLLEERIRETSLRLELAGCDLEDAKNSEEEAEALAHMASLQEAHGLHLG